MPLPAGQGRGGPSSPILNTVKFQGDVATGQSSKQNQSHLSPAAKEKEAEARLQGGCPLAHCQPSLPPSPVPKDQEHLAAGLAPGGVSGRRGLLPPGPNAAVMQGTSIKPAGLAGAGKGAGSFPPPPQTFLRNGISFPVHLLPTRRALPSTVCTFKPQQPCLFLGKGVPQGGPRRNARP